MRQRLLKSSQNNLSALLFCGVLYSDDSCYEIVRSRLSDTFGPFLFETEARLWHSNHYSDELGSPIYRRFVFFSELMHQGDIASIKLQTIGIEKDTSVDGRRTLNIDPGYLNLSKVVLPTTKDYSHRIYLSDGIFAETTLIYQAGEFKKGLFAYSDFTEPETLALFKRMREEFIGKLSG